MTWKLAGVKVCRQHVISKSSSLQAGRTSTPGDILGNHHDNMLLTVKSAGGTLGCGAALLLQGLTSFQSGRERWIPNSIGNSSGSCENACRVLINHQHFSHTATKLVPDSTKPLTASNNIVNLEWVSLSVSSLLPHYLLQYPQLRWRSAHILWQINLPPCSGPEFVIEFWANNFCGILISSSKVARSEIIRARKRSPLLRTFKRNILLNNKTWLQTQLDRKWFKMLGTQNSPALRAKAGA